MAKEKKKSKRQLEKEYVPLRGLMGNAQDYHVYDMTFGERIVGFGIGFGIDFLVVFVFFRVIWFCMLTGVIAGLFSVRPYREYLKRKRKERLLLQFKDLLEELTTSFSVGANTLEAFSDSLNDLVNIYGEDSYIVNEVRIICSGLANGIIVEELLADFAKRSDLEDVQSFADVFAVANRQGGNIKQIVAQTRNVINDKIEIEMEISSLLNSSKNEINILIVMPLVIVLALGSGSELSVSDNSLTNVVVKLICLGIFGIAYILGKKITDVKL